jgi:uncharacterized protein YfiM (DUF2279 family)
MPPHRRSQGDFAVGLNAGLNAGQARATDHDRLLGIELDIEDELGASAVWPGKAAYKGVRNRA